MVNRHAWIESRLAFLEQLLRDDPPGTDRAAVEAEIEALRHERRPRFLRRWLHLGGDV